MGWRDKTRKLTIDPILMDSRVVVDGTEAIVILTEYTDDGTQNKQAILVLDSWDAEALTRVFADMMRAQADHVDKARNRVLSDVDP